MGRKLLSYQDAATLLGAESKVFAALSKVATAGAGAVSAGGSEVALSLLGIKGEVDRLGQDAVVGCATG